MGDRIVLFAVLLVVPLFALGVGYLIEWNYEAKWRTAVLEQYPDLDRKHLDAMPLRRYCAEVNESREMPACTWYPAVQMMLRGALAAIVVGIGLVLAIFLMGRVSRGSRNRLVLVFKPGLYLTLIALVFLALLHSSLFLAAMTLGQIATVGHMIVIGMFFMLAVGLGAVVSIILLIRAIFLMLKTPPTLVVGRTVSERRGPFLWKYIRDLAFTIKALPPENIIVGFDPNFFVIEATVKCFNGLIKGRTLYLSLPLCRILSEPEFRAIVGHELGHFKGNDTKFSRRFAPIYRGALEALGTLQASRSTGISGIAMMPAINLLAYYFEAFATAKNEIGRDRELAADATGAELSSRQAMGLALVKVHAFADLWEGALQRMRDWLNERKTVPNVSAIYADYVGENSDPSRLIGLGDECLAHPLDTHPPLKTRLDALGVSIESIQAAALATSPENPSVRLIDHYADIEAELTKMEQALLEKTGEVSKNAQIQCPACGKLSPVSADACSCGLRFGRSMA